MGPCQYHPQASGVAIVTSRAKKEVGLLLKAEHPSAARFARGGRAGVGLGVAAVGMGSIAPLLSMAPLLAEAPLLDPPRAGAAALPVAALRMLDTSTAPPQSRG